MSKFSQIATGTIFETTNGRYRKLDELYYEDLAGGFQSAWSPLFDNTITSVKTVVNPDAPTEEAYIVDPQSRMITKNPAYGASLSSSEKAFAELWGSALFDCAPEDYEYMTQQSIKALVSLQEMASLIQVTNVGTDIQINALIRFLVTATTPAVAPVVEKPVSTPGKKKPAKKSVKKAAKKTTSKGNR